MANPKNTNRSKRKYGDKRQAATARNKAAKALRAELHEQKKMDRTKALVGHQVEVRTGSYGKIVGVVREIVSAPACSSRTNGQFVVIRHNDEDIVRSRHRVKVVR